MMRYAGLAVALCIVFFLVQIRQATAARGSGQFPRIPFPGTCKKAMGIICGGPIQ